MLAEVLQLEEELPGSEPVADDQAVFDVPPAEPEVEIDAEPDDETPVKTRRCRMSRPSTTARRLLMKRWSSSRRPTK